MYVLTTSKELDSNLYTFTGTKGSQIQRGGRTVPKMKLAIIVLASLKLMVKKSKCLFFGKSLECMRRAMDPEDRACLWLPAFPGRNRAGTPLNGRDRPVIGLQR